MVDVVTALGVATTAFNVIKKGFSVGRDVETMAGDLSRWMGAMSDLDQAEKEAKNPPIFKKLFAGKSVEQEAMEVFAAKRKAQEQREELKQWISFTLGPSAWQDLIRTEVDIRKRRQETIYKQQEKKRKLFEALAIIFIIALFAASILGVAWLYRINKANALSMYFPDRPNLEYSYYQSSYRQPF
jgi:hypothetical protein